MKEYKSEFEGKKILVTGGVGSIGKEIVKQLLSFNPDAIRVLDTNETGLFEFQQELLPQKTHVTFLLGDVRDKERMNRALENIDVVFHAAALKHVPLCEYNPFEAIKTNVMGTQNVIDACLNNNVKKMVFISTDKAVSPTNVMGASKLLGERLTIAGNYYKGARRTNFFCVRFGNVLASRGSVVPLFYEQIKKGGPVTVTDPEMTRFIMSIPSSVNLILKATTIANGGEIFILKMPAIKIGDLARAMIEKCAAECNQKSEKITIKIIGKRMGERKHEELLTSLEAERADMVDEDLIAIYSETDPTPKQGLTKTLNSKDGPFLTVAQIKSTIERS